MKKAFLITLTFVFISCGIFAQVNDTTEIKHLRGAIFSQNGKQLSNSKLTGIMRTNPDAYAKMNQANANLPGMYIFSYAGGFMIGWPIGTAIGGGDPNWGIAAAGVGCVLLSIPLANGYKKNAKEAVSIYNNGLIEETSFRQKKIKLNLCLNGNGIGLRMNLY